MRQLFTLSPFATVAAGLLLFGTSAAQAQTVYGLVSSTAASTPISLVTFDAATPGTFTATVPVTGSAAGQTLVGLDARPNTGQLFALGYNPTGTVAQLYTLNIATGVLTPVGAALTLNLGTNTSRIGFDFNPTVDRIRVAGSNNANVRLNPNNGALAATDTNLAYAADDANAAQTPGIGSVAYSNSFIGATFTVLYDIDEANSRYTRQDPPNNGVLLSREALTVNTATALATDLDIYFDPTAASNRAYLTVATGTAAAPATQLYTLDFLTGANMTAVGAVGPAGTLVTDIAFAINRPATLPAITGQLVYALAGTNLLTFDTAQPSFIRTSTGVSGIPTDQSLVGIDVRPATNTLYGLGYRASDQMAQLYTINANTGVATAVADPVMLALGSGPIGFDFNPAVDRVRVVSFNRANYRLNPITGAIVDGNATTDGIQADGQLTYNPGNATSTPPVAADPNAAATPAIVTAAYTNSFAGATTTDLYDYDRALNVLARQSPPNDGILNTIGSSGLTLNAAPLVSLDIYTAAAGATPMAYLAANTAASANVSFYTVDLSTGAATLVGAIGNNISVRDIAVAVGTGVVTTGVRDRELAVGLGLYPNPFASTAQVRFELTRATQVELLVSDALGRHVATVKPGKLGPGTHTLRWDGAGQRRGLYFFRLKFDGQPAGTRQGVLE